MFSGVHQNKLVHEPEHNMPKEQDITNAEPYELAIYNLEMLRETIAHEIKKLKRDKFVRTITGVVDMPMYVHTVVHESMKLALIAGADSKQSG